MRVVLVGAGIGGLTAALALAARGVRPLLLERAPALAEVGAGLQLSPNAVRVLDRLGLAPALRRDGFAPEAVEVRAAPSGRRLLRTELGAAAQTRWGAPYLQLRRTDLQTILLQALHARDAAALRLGAEVVAVERDGVRLADGERVAAEAVIGCDGVRSRVRAAVVEPDAPRFTGQVAWRAMIPAERLPLGLVPPTAQVWTGRGRHLVHYYVAAGRMVNLAAFTEARDWRIESWTEAGDPAALAALFAGWPEPVPTLLAQAEAVHRWALYDRPIPPRWSRGPVALLGDAAHPMLPYLAQGAGMAIEDAAVLAAELASGRPVEAALAAYSAARRGRVAKVVAWSTRNSKLFHLPQPLARGLFGAATALDGLEPSRGLKRLDWLYGGGPP